MAVVGSAEVVVRAITLKVKDDIKKAFDDAKPQVALAGKDHAKSYTDQFKTAMGSSLTDSIDTSLGKVDAGKAGASSGGDWAGSFMKSASTGIDIPAMFDDIDLKPQGDKIGRDLGTSIDKGFKPPDIEKSMTESGRKAGDGFSKGFKGSSFNSEATAAANAFAKLYAGSQFLGAGLGLLVSGLADTVSGLFAMGSAAAQSAGALGALGGVMGAVIQGGIAMKLAFSGVGAALKAGLAPAPAAAAKTASAANAAAKAVLAAQKAIADAYRQASRSIEAAEQRVADAQRVATRAVKDAKDNLRGAYADAAQAAADSARKVADAERDVGDAQRGVLIAQLALTDARKAGAESLQQLAFSAEGAALSEQRAGLSLQDAYAKLQAVQTQPADSKQRVEAELTFKEAELHFRESKDRAADLKAEEAKAAKAGVDGTKEVIGAKNDVLKAKNDEIEAENKLGKARADQANSAIENANKIAKAQAEVRQAEIDGAREIAEAQRALNRAREDGARKIAEAQAALADALKSQKAVQDESTKSVDKYAEALKKLSPEQQKFVKYLVSIQGELKKVKAAAGEELFPKLQQALEPIVNKLFPIFEDKLRTTGGILGDIALDISKFVTSTEGLKLIGEVMDGNNAILDAGRPVISNIVVLFLRLLKAVNPLTITFAKFLTSMTDGFVKATDTADGMEKLTGWFDQSGKVAGQLFRIFGNLFGIIGGLGSAAKESGQDLLDAFEKSTAKLETFIKTPEKQKALGEFFKQASANFKSIAGLIGKVAVGFLKLGGSKDVGKAFDKLKEAGPYVEKIMLSLQKAAPYMAEFVVQIARFVASLLAGDSSVTFFETLGKVAKKLGDFFSNDLVQKMLLAVAPILGMLHAFKLVNLAGKGVFKILLGAFAPLSTGLGVLEKFPGSLGRVAGAAKRALDNVSNIGKNVPKAAAPVAGAAPGDATKAAASKAFSGIGTAAKAVISPIGLVVLAIAGIVTAFVILYKKNAAFRDWVNGLVAKFREFVDFVRNVIIPILVDKLVSAFKAIGDWIKTSVIPAFQQLGGYLKDTFGPIFAALRSFLEEVILPAFRALRDYLVNVVLPGFVAFGTGIYNAMKPVIDFFVNTWAPMVSAAVGMVVAFFKQQLLPIFQIIVPAAINFFKNYVSTAFAVIGAVIRAAVAVIVFIITKILVPIFVNVIIPVIGLVLKTFVFVFKLIAAIVTATFKVISFVIMKIAVPLFMNVVVPLIKFVWAMFKFFFVLIRNIVIAVFEAIRKVYNNVLKPTMDLLIAVVRFVINAVKTKFQEMKDKWNTIVNGIKEVWNKVGKPWLDSMKEYWGTKVDKVKGIIDSIRSAWETAINAIKTWWAQHGQKVIDDIGTKFSNFGAGVTKIWEAIKDSPKTGLRNLINNLNNWLVTPLNALTSKFGLDIPKIQMPQGLAEGGEVTGKGGPKDDKEIRRLSPGEWVIKESSVRSIGRQQMAFMNRTGQLPTSPVQTIARGGVWTDAKNKVGDLKDSALDKFRQGKDKVENLLEKGAGFAIETVMKGFKQFLPQGGGFIEDLLRRIFEKTTSVGKDWGDRKQAEADAAAAAAANDGSGTAGGFSGARGVWNALRTAGINAVQAAGIMGNMEVESGFMWQRVQGGGVKLSNSPNHGAGYGLVQWTPGTKLGKMLGDRPNNLENQIAVLVEQLKGKHGMYQESAAGKALFAAKTVGAAARAFMLRYERPANQSGAAQANRAGRAARLYKRFKGVEIINPDEGLDGGIGLPGGGGNRQYKLGAVKAAVKWAAQSVGNAFGIKTIYGMGGGSVAGSYHPRGLGLDFMINNLKNGHAVGNKLEKFLRANAKGYGINQLIWDKHIRTAERGWDNRRGYSGPSDHTDHVHTSFGGKLPKKPFYPKSAPKPSAGGGAGEVPSNGKSGWGYPLGRRARSARTYAGHRLPGSYDLATPIGNPVLAAAAGKVLIAKYLGNRSYGRYVQLAHANGVKTLYAHLSKEIVSVGQKVGRGQRIGSSGNSGGSTGPHLHFQLTPSSNTKSAMAKRGVRLATGGIVQATDGGVIAMIGEAGRNERVEPLDSQGLSVRDRALIELLTKNNGGSGTGIVDVRVYIGDTELNGLVDMRITARDKKLAQNLNVGSKRRYQQ